MSLRQQRIKTANSRPTPEPTYLVQVRCGCCSAATMLQSLLGLLDRWSQHHYQGLRVRKGAWALSLEAGISWLQEHLKVRLFGVFIAKVTVTC